MAFELSIFAAFGAMFCWGFGDFFIQKVTRRIGDVEALAFIGIIGSVGLLPFALQDLQLLFSLPNLALLFFIGAITFVAAMFDFEALKNGKLSVVEIMLEFELPVTAVLAFFILGEVISMKQFFVIMLAFIGIVLMSSKFPRKHFLKKLEKGVLLGFVAAVGMAIVNFSTAIGSKQVSPIMAIWIPWIVCTLISLIVIWRRGSIRTVFGNASKFWLLLAAMGIFDTLAWLLYATAVLKNEIAITTAITESYPAIGVFLGVLINREKIFFHQYAGAILALGASIVLAFLV